MIELRGDASVLRVQLRGAAGASTIDERKRAALP
jgi:hypothetical protein